jgi:hypothetical protein
VPVSESLTRVLPTSVSDSELPSGSGRQGNGGLAPTRRLYAVGQSPTTAVMQLVSFRAFRKLSRPLSPVINR